MSAASDADLAEAITFARSQNVDLFVLGGGSNLLVADKGFSGAVVHVANRGIREQADGASTIFSVAAGENWDAFVNYVVEKDFAGIECMAGIPGTVGGTPVQNVGAYGQEVASTIVSVRALDRKTLRVVEFAGPNCNFGYRRSIFNTTSRDRYIVTDIGFRLRPHGAPHLAFAELAAAFAGKPTPRPAQVSKMVREIRRRKGMLLVEGDANCRSAGSFFKNPVVTESQFADVSARVTKEANLSGLAQPETIPHFVSEPGTVKLLAGWLIEHAGFPRGFALGQAGISTKHTLAIVNRGEATAASILALRDQIRQRVLAQFGICLEQEPVYLTG
jgi:UDP-N-acetylmuramate dehydrogenase